MNLRFFILWLIISLGTSPILRAEVKLGALFSENAVLQAGMPIPVWGTGRDGEAVRVSLDGRTAEAVVENGRWQVKLPAHSASGPWVLTVKGDNELAVSDVWIGEVWICSGQSNMERQLGLRTGQQPLVNWEAEAAAANFPLLRHFAVKKTTSDEPIGDVQGNWVVCTPQTVSEFSAVGYYFGRDLMKHLGVAVGLIHTSWGGTPAESWTRQEALAESMPEVLDMQKAALEKYEADILLFQQAQPQLLADWQKAAESAKLAGQPEPKKPAAPQNPAKTQNRPSCLYNGMLAPIIPYAMRGVIWYQGETNGARPLHSAAGPITYRRLFPLMISDWRKQWGEGDFPFLFVQVAPYRGMTPEIRESQLVSWKNTPQTAMVVTTDVGDAVDIHPNRKEPVGQRLALAARALAYGEKVEYSGPCFESATFADGQATVVFSHAKSGLLPQIPGDPLTGFEIAGADQVFHSATAKAENEHLVVVAADVPNPVSVRYGWAAVPVVNLVNGEGLPASPFRSDSAPLPPSP